MHKTHEGEKRVHPERGDEPAANCWPAHHHARVNRNSPEESRQSLDEYLAREAACAPWYDHARECFSANYYERQFAFLLFLHLGTICFLMRDNVEECLKPRFTKQSMPRPTAACTVQATVAWGFDGDDITSCDLGVTYIEIYIVSETSKWDALVTGPD
ncbi:hypothetical protein B0H12DRAFT_1073406 [Mycena haematopus]|nr:hypothetical protein B0H12DRAFT_1073406 [Mycena haematopus]